MITIERRGKKHISINDEKKAEMKRLGVVLLGTPPAILTVWSFMRGTIPKTWETIEDFAAWEIDKIMREVMI